MEEQIDELEAEIYELAGHEFTIGSPQQLGDGPVRRARADARSAAARPASRPTPACSAQIRDEHPIVAKVERWRELTKLKNTYLDSLPELVDARPAASTRPSTR